ncbi:MAG TPA: glycosyltransferase family 4 protein [Solirubrobacteraceae bacterium]|nr:glycosyltransferase family 4 protein [Solirubrobacteraceae bacterium]
MAAHVAVSAAALASHGVEVTVVAALVDAGAEVPGVSIRHAPELFDGRASTAQRIGAPSADAPDVFHLHQVDDPDLLDGLRDSAPVVVSAHGFTACTSGVHYFAPGQECTRAHGLGCVPNLVARGCAHTRYPKTLPVKYRNATRGRRALERADLSVSYSSAVDRHLAANGIARRAIVPYFPTMAPKQGSGHSERRRVVFAGRIVPPKGVGVLIGAAVDVDAEFLLCGDGHELEAMRELAARLGVAERVRFTGWLDADDLARELAEASVVVMPSLWPEPFGLVGIEGFAAGRPAVASATGGIGDWLTDGVSGRSVPPGDAGALGGALSEMLADPERQRQMGLAGKATVAARFSPERHVEALLEGYASARSHWLATAARGGVGRQASRLASARPSSS